jgi:hypothetical protein
MPQTEKIGKNSLRVSPQRYWLTAGIPILLLSISLIFSLVYFLVEARKTKMSSVPKKSITTLNNRPKQKVCISEQKNINEANELLIYSLGLKEFRDALVKNYDNKETLVSIAQEENGMKNTIYRDVNNNKLNFGYFSMQWGTIKGMQRIDSSLPNVTEEEFIKSPQIQMLYCIAYLKYAKKLAKNDIGMLNFYNSGHISTFNNRYGNSISKRKNEYTQYLASIR